jgi:hypothetical protein
MEYKLEQDDHSGVRRYYIYLHTDIKIEPIAVIYNDYILAKKFLYELNKGIKKENNV